MVLIAGHSLGGGISELVGVCAGVQAVSIEGPGVLESQIGMLRESWMQVNGNFNLQANGDIVPFMGTHSGISQRIDCQVIAFLVRIALIVLLITSPIASGRASPPSLLRRAT